MQSKRYYRRNVKKQLEKNIESNLTFLFIKSRRKNTMKNLNNIAERVPLDI